ncbi:MAG TPA: DsbA family protein [Longimicrobiales bacterium]|nr:DsbA family protein [Longimicrobiales bacterium]
MAERRVAVYSDYVSPVCYLAWVVLRRAASAGVVVTLRPYELWPAPLPMPPSDGPRERRLWDAVIAPNAARLGVEVRPPAAWPRTRKAHELALYAAREGRADQAHEALFHAYFVEGRDIGRIDVLAELAARMGLDPTAAKVELDIDQYSDAVRETRSHAAALGVNAIPAYIDETGSRPRLHTGALEYEELMAWLEQES